MADRYLSQLKAYRAKCARKLAPLELGLSPTDASLQLPRVADLRWNISELDRMIARRDRTDAKGS